MHTGWKPDTREHIEEAPVFSLRRLTSSSANGSSQPPSTLPKTCDFLSAHCTVRDQGETSACVGFAFTGAILARLRRLGFNPPLFSPALPYKVGRMFARVSKHDDLQDDGSFPYLVARAIRRYGLCLESEHRFDPETINEEPDFLAFAQASRFRLESFSRIIESGEERARVVMRCLAEGEPVVLGMMVGDEFRDYVEGSDPIGVESGYGAAGHMTFLVGYEEDGMVFKGCNSWGQEQGDRGFFRISRDKLLHPTTSDLYHVVVMEE